MKSTVKRVGIKYFRWFVNKSGLIDKPHKATNRLLFGLFGVFALTSGVPYVVDVGTMFSVALSIIGIVAILCMMGVMILGMVLETDRRGNSKLRNYLDGSQTRLDSYQDK